MLCLAILLNTHLHYVKYEQIKRGLEHEILVLVYCTKADPEIQQAVKHIDDYT